MYFCGMRHIILTTFLSVFLLSCSHEPPPFVKMEGWWTMSEGQHFFEDSTNVPVKFVGEELWGMEEYYSELVPEMGLPVQAIIMGRMNGDTLEIQTLEIAPEGCED